MHPTDDQYDEALEYARARGAEDGAEAGRTYIAESLLGCTPDAARGVAQRILDAIYGNDQELYDSLPYPDLSGQWADTLTGPELVRQAWAEAGVDVDSPDEDADDFDAICSAYDGAFYDAVRRSVVEAVRAILCKARAPRA